jgi:hypothetical protein
VYLAQQVQMSMENGGNRLTVSTIGRIVFKLDARRKGYEQARKACVQGP